MRRKALAWLLLPLLAGCLQRSGEGADGGAADPEDGVTTLDLQVVDNRTLVPVAKASLEIRFIGANGTAAPGTLRKTTDDDGRARATVAPVATCAIRVTHVRYVSGAVSVDCLTDRAVRIPLRALGNGTLGNSTLPPGPGPGNGTFRVAGTVRDAQTSAPLPGARVRLDPPLGALTHTDANGTFALAAVPGPHTLHVDASCVVAAEFDLVVEADVELDLRAARSTPGPLAASGVTATPGPGAGMVTVSWADTPGATGYRILRNGQPFHEVGHSRAYGVPGALASDRFALVALDGCGGQGPVSGEVSAAPLPGPIPLAPTVRQPSVAVREEPFGVLSPAGTAQGVRSWRIVTGTGNCCENYIATTATGRILDQGGSRLAFSDDEGKTWSGVQNPAVVLAGEGSVAAAPDGDIVAFDWATYNADTAFSYRYSAATQTWASQVVKIQTPVYDRPWIATIKGPFLVGGLVVPYVTVVEGGTGLKDPLLISLDGLNYAPSNSFSTFGTGTVDLRGFVTSPDANRDWMSPMAEFGVVPLDNGVGILELVAAMRGTPTWSTATLPTIPHPVVRVDSAGAWHAADVQGSILSYAISPDAGANWARVRIELPSNWSVGEWDFRASAALDQAVFAVNADVAGRVQQAAVRLRGLDGVPVLQEILLVGKGDGAFGSGILEDGNRFDFMTLGFLPDGRIVMSAADARGTAPFVAIEL